MKIKSVEISGFRGFSDTHPISFGSNFTIITGRNGSGKSSICDAIEFALTGDIQRFKDITPKTRKDEAHSYLWWKGDCEPKKREVCVKLSNKDVTLEVRRNHRGQLVGLTDPDLFRSLVVDSDQDKISPNTLDRIVRSSFIRDEMISELSLDLGDRDRFNFVSEIMGFYDLSPYIQTLEKAHQSVKKRLVSEKVRLEYADTQIFNIRTNLSNKSLQSIPAVIRSTLTTIQQMLSLTDTAANAIIISEARRTLFELDTTLSQIDSIKSDISILEPGIARIEDDKNELISLNQTLQSIKDEISEITSQLPEGSSPDNELRLYIELATTGKELGLTKDGCCPLCGNESTESQYAQHIDEIESRARLLESKIAHRNRLRTEFHRLGVRKAQLTISIEGITSKELSLRETWNGYENNIGESLQKLVIPRRTKPIDSFKNLTDRVFEIESFGVDLKTRLEAEIETVKDFTFPESINQNEALINKIQQDRNLKEISVSEYGKLENELLEAKRSAQRLAGRFLDDRLVDLDPLLAELYTRLKPHSLWSKIRADIRGDVRRSLSLTVESEDRSVNPGFVFSSGERRAAGLAFLTSLALSNPWTQLNTVIFDDPVQHIDDYRALHLVETLAAICKTGKQIICTVEDPALAKLMNRRIVSSYSADGYLVEMTMDKTGVRVARNAQILPPSSTVLAYVAQQ